jgi:hypothetical protein
MSKTRPILVSLTAGALWAASGFASGPVPEPFQGHDPESRFIINYGDVDAILDAMVVVVGPSSYENADPSAAPTGTRMKTRSSRSTAREGNRLQFEAFKDNPDYQTALHNVRLSLQTIPGSMPLAQFSRTEQLAYWLNLHNITLIDELLKIYPERELKSELEGRQSIPERKILDVAGVPLSLNDIRHTILVRNYNGNPLVMYGLFQGIIGGPNIRKQAYTGANVQRNLEANAREFINSNRGTAFYKDGIFKVSNLYEEYPEFFPDLEANLKLHLMEYMDFPERRKLFLATKFKPDLDDWSIADVFGAHREVRGSFSTSPAAMFDAVVSNQPDGQGGTAGTNFSAASSGYVAKTMSADQVQSAQQERLGNLEANPAAANLVRQGRVTIEELGTAPPEPAKEDADDPGQ